jgi:peptide/nickel transport system ATP-binding protein
MRRQQALRCMKRGKVGAGDGLPEKALSRQQFCGSPLARSFVEFALGEQDACVFVVRHAAIVARFVVMDDGSLHAPTPERLDLLAQLQRELGVADLFITHNFGVVEYLAHDIAVMRADRIVEAGAAERVLERPRHKYKSCWRRCRG